MLYKIIRKGVSFQILPFLLFVRKSRNYIIPPMPPIPGAGIAGAGFSSFLSAITHSVVKNMPAIEAAFSRATRVTLAGSITLLQRNFHRYLYGRCIQSLLLRL